MPLSVTLTVSIRDTSGNPLDSPGVVSIHGGPENAFRTAVTQSASAAVFSGVGQGEYEAEVKCVGYQTTTEHLSVSDMGTMQEVRKVNPDLPPPRIVACRTDNTTVGKAIEEGLRKKFGGSVFQAAIPRGKDVPAAHAARRPLLFHAPRSKAAIAYEALAAEVRDA